MGARKVPVIVTNLATGEEVRYPSYIEAAAALGTSASKAQRASLCDFRCRGHRIRREDDWIMDKGRK